MITKKLQKSTKEGAATSTGAAAKAGCISGRLNPLLPTGSRLGKTGCACKFFPVPTFWAIMGIGGTI
jgi:hypothetical protein